VVNLSGRGDGGGASRPAGVAGWPAQRGRGRGRLQTRFNMQPGGSTLAGGRRPLEGPRCGPPIRPHLAFWHTSCDDAAASVRVASVPRRGSIMMLPDSEPHSVGRSLGTCQAPILPRDSPGALGRHGRSDRVLRVCSTLPLGVRSRAHSARRCLAGQVGPGLCTLRLATRLRAGPDGGPAPGRGPAGTVTRHLAAGLVY
jgi:hypothetical protein